MSLGCLWFGDNSDGVSVGIIGGMLTCVSGLIYTIRCCKGSQKMLNLHERRVKIFENLCYDIIYLYFSLLKRSLAVCFLYPVSGMYACVV